MGILHVGSPGEPSELDPHIINAPPDFKIVPMLFDGLVKGDPATLEARPAVASSWEISEDGLTYTFHLRENAKWSNGDKVTSADFLYSWRRALTPALGSQYTFLFTDVVGADDFNAGKTTDFSTVGFAAPDPATVVITLQRPTAYFLSNIANNAVWLPVHRETIEAAGAISDRSSGWTNPDSMVSNGPFKLAEWRPNEFIRLERASTYWNAEQVGINGIVFHAFDNANTEELAFRADQLHRTVWVPASKLPGYREQPDSPLVETEELNTRFLNFNTKYPPFNDARVRRAFALAIDRQALAEHVYLGAASPAYRVVPNGMPNYPAEYDINYAPDEARRLLAEAGFPDGAGFPQADLSTEAGGTANLPEALQAKWKTVLNVDVSILNSETRVHWDKLNRKDYTIAIGGWTADYPDATTYLDLWKEGSGYNFTNWTDPAYDRLLAEAAQITDAGARQRALRQAEAFLMQAMPIIPLAFEKGTVLQHPTMQGFIPNAMDRVDYRTVRLEAGP